MRETTINEEKVVGIEFYSSNTKGIGGIIKKNEDDFKVIEDSDVEKDEYGEHLCLIVEKKGITTENMISIIGNELGIDKKFIGYAGNKDKNAITVQKISIPYSDKIFNKISKINTFSSFKIIDRFRIKRKIRLGYLKGNFFEIYVRDCETGKKETQDIINKIFDEINKNGVPNYFGIQRFGTNINTHIYGKALIKREYEKFIEMMKTDNFFNKMINKNLEKNNLLKTIKSIPYSFLDIFIAGYQSYLFNKILSERMRKFGLEKIEGDFVNSKKEVVIPIIGYKSKFPNNEMKEIIEDVMEKEGIKKEDFKHEIKFLSRKGDLRKIKLNFKDFSYKVEENEKIDVQFKFYLEKGCYATVLLREFCKNL